MRTDATLAELNVHKMQCRVKVVKFSANEWTGHLIANPDRKPKCKKALRLSLRSRNAQWRASGRSPDLRLRQTWSAFPGLLAHPPQHQARMGTFPVAVAQVLSDYSCGAVADSHRASHYQTKRTYMRAARAVKGF